MKENCKTTVFRGFMSEPCWRAAKLDGYCGIHHPDAVAARRETARARNAELLSKSCAEADARGAAAVRARRLAELAERLIPWVQVDTISTESYWVVDDEVQDTLRELYEMRR